jgi:hypothetical protein
VLEPDPEMGDYGNLWLEAPGKKRELAGVNPADLRTLGVFLAEHTGWPLDAPEEVQD